MKPNTYQQAYSNQQVVTAPPGELTLMLYNGAIKFLRQGKIGLEKKDYNIANTNILKTQNIIKELMCTLKMEYAISKNLMELYDFMNNHLVQANIKKDVQAAEDVLGLLEELRDTWVTVIKTARQQQAAAGQPS